MTLPAGLDRVLRTAVALAFERREAWDELDATAGDVGIHGEPGHEREPLAEGPRLARALLDPVLDEVDADRPQLLLLSGLGGTALLHLQALLADVCDELADHGVRVERSLVGDLITSLDQPGAVLTLVPLDEQRRELWDAPVSTPALVRGRW